ncbi:DegV family protein [Alkalibacter saccharofermentans]|uniref:EDD domain protein, DegV family n=1 Tax=Alkalibacter saccharofermentans DSM 14828 TaxID=1120975 RepID=A0A1M4U9Z6_9FIRM|nr:DegV family protein [Alkalibacter saccharofermentans]SHE53504.1 EDD domain protein, DegV family [Alkalibacter saccharofermentans DSM 14828]
MGIKLITDSACDLSKEYLKTQEVELIPIYISLDGNDFKDGIDITPEEIYQGMRDGKVYKTAQITIKDFEKIFEKYAQAGDEILYLSFSSGLSGTCNAAQIAANAVKEKYPNAKIQIIDTKAAVNGLGLIVKKAVDGKNNGMSFEDLIKSVESDAAKIEHIFTVEDLNYLYRGGRLSKGAAVVGNMLNIQPILRVDEDGKLEQLDKVRGRKKLFGKILKLMEDKADDLGRQTIGISHGDDQESAEKLVEMIKERFGSKDFIISMMGAAIGAHTGPGTLCVFFFNTKK